MTRYTPRAIFRELMTILSRLSHHPHEVLDPQPDDNCPTCLEPYRLDEPGHCTAIRLLECGHVVGDVCMSKWQKLHPNRCINWNHELTVVDEPVAGLQAELKELATAWKIVSRTPKDDTLLRYDSYLNIFLQKHLFPEYRPKEVFGKMFVWVFTGPVPIEDALWPLAEPELTPAMEALKKGIRRRALALECTHVLQLLFFMFHSFLFDLLDVPILYIWIITASVCPTLILNYVRAYTERRKQTNSLLELLEPTYEYMVELFELFYVEPADEDNSTL